MVAMSSVGKYIIGLFGEHHIRKPGQCVEKFQNGHILIWEKYNIKINAIYYSLEGFMHLIVSTPMHSLKLLVLLKDYTSFLSFTGNVFGIVQSDETLCYFIL